MKKIWVKTYEDLDDSTFEGTVDEVACRLKEKEDELTAAGNRDISLRWYSNYAYQVVRVHYMRPETDEEMDKRRKKLEARLKKIETDEAKRRDLIESLKNELAE